MALLSVIPTSAPFTTSAGTTADCSLSWSTWRARPCSSASRGVPSRWTRCWRSGLRFRGRPRRGARRRHRPPRRQAGQHLRHRAAARQDSRFRVGTADWSGSPSGTDYTGGNRSRHGRLHVAGTGAWSTARRAHRPVLARKSCSLKWRRACAPWRGRALRWRQFRTWSL